MQGVPGPQNSNRSGAFAPPLRAALPYPPPPRRFGRCCTLNSRARCQACVWCQISNWTKYRALPRPNAPMPPALDELAADARQTCWVCPRSPFLCCCFCLVVHFHFTSSHQLHTRSTQLLVAFMIYFAFVLHRAILAADDAPADPAAGSVCLVWSSSLVFFRSLCYFFIWNHSYRRCHRSPYFYGGQLYRRCFLRYCLCLRGYD